MVMNDTFSQENACNSCKRNVSLVYLYICWNVMLCGTMSCLQDQTLWCEAELWVEHRGCLSSIKGVIL